MNTSRSLLKKLSWIAIGLFAFPGLALAHPDHSIQSFTGGLLHPFTGPDHILAMIAVGLWATQLKGRAVWALPLSFVGLMMVGGMINAFDLTLIGVEPMILSSSLILGLLVAKKVSLPTVVSMGLVGFFALFHGYAHVAEMATGSLPSTLAGFVIATMILNGIGLTIGRGITHFAHDRRLQWAGAATVLASLAIIGGIL